MHKKNLRKYRNKIDELDNKIFILIKNRTQLIKHILSEKKFKNQIVDRKRINAILKKIKNRSIRNGIDPKITRRIWKAMIWSYIDFERMNFKKNNYLLWGGSFFSTNISCLRVEGLYFLTLSFTLAFSPEEGFFT